MAQDDFELWLGRIGKDRPFAQQVRKAANLAGARIGLRPPARGASTAVGLAAALVLDACSDRRIASPRFGRAAWS